MRTAAVICALFIAAVLIGCAKTAPAAQPTVQPTTQPTVQPTQTNTQTANGYDVSVTEPSDPTAGTTVDNTADPTA